MKKTYKSRTAYNYLKSAEVKEMKSGEKIIFTDNDMIISGMKFGQSGQAYIVLTDSCGHFLDTVDASSKAEALWANLRSKRDYKSSLLAAMK